MGSINGITTYVTVPGSVPQRLTTVLLDINHVQKSYYRQILLPFFVANWVTAEKDRKEYGEAKLSGLFSGLNLVHQY